MISKESVLSRTGQAWKYWAMLLSSVVSILLVFWVTLFGTSLPSPWYITILLLGILVAIVSIVLPCVAIKCPVCGAKWFWFAVSKKHSLSRLDELFVQSSCPVCGTADFPRRQTSQK